MTIETFKKDLGFAFFDVDGTLINIKSMISFRNYLYENLSSYKGFLGFLRKMYQKLIFDFYVKCNFDREIINRKYYEGFRGLRVLEVEGHIASWYQSAKKGKGFFIDESVARLNLHKANGVDAVFVSGSFVELLKPIAEELGVKHCLAINMEKKDGVYTGKILPPQTIGDGKAEIVKSFLSESGIKSSDCYAYGDHYSDIPMLEIVGHPTAVVGDISLAQHAEKNKWDVIFFAV